ncbi:hypothetical protein NQ317_013551 [Molorchus minor]|uniref:Uncharacterized protein n=1 Tax=Molorchus minor TaxID=1323400 RepID=A0ABQ9JVZ8_9CUCU|nr:hypothetical protein NQ317_013551 [Molorchus minor]
MLCAVCSVMSSNKNAPQSGEKRQFTAEEWTYLTNYFVGNNYRHRENIIIPKKPGPSTDKN